jgi:hypothetical protein
MAGRWREARLMAAQDVPAGEVNARLEQWAGLAPSDAYQRRIAVLLDVPTGVADGGLPVHLALGNTPSIQQLAAEAVASPAAELAAAPAAQPAPLPVLASAAELPSLFEAAPAPAAARVSAQQSPTTFASAFAAPAATPGSQQLFSEPVVQAIPSRQVAAASAPRQRAAASQRFSDEALRSPAPVQASADGTHLVQLGSFLSEAGAQRAWNIYVARYPELASRERVITQAVVHGRNYWRVSAGGFDQRASRAMCSRVNSGANAGCISWAANRPLPGAIDSGIRLARR